MRNYVQRGDTVTVTAPYNVNSGAGVLVGSLFGVAATKADQGQEVEVATVGVFQLGGGLAQGAKAYWDDAAKAVTATTAGNTFIGHSLGGGNIRLSI